ncbi:uncharacterized protein LOC131144873 isoform X2 [Malania oleifera]|uniref:uncharacterized protein LOC131144873 isoform X2 n=1 Tax=Malania oleifera TaxID=397392 RepID=UPI0025AEA1D4|nr:uncharacterized protein LOC131144873 isoform X2 [Malania oleifera]
MDESWRMRMGLPTIPGRRSTVQTSSDQTHNLSAGDVQILETDDFSDVFGGPPRSVLSRQLFMDTARSRSTSFYDEIFRPPVNVSPASTGLCLPSFRIPASRGRSSEFYSDIFGSDDGRRSRSRSKGNSKSTNSSSVLSSEELSPHRPMTGDDMAFSSYTSKLRPINVPCTWSSSTMMLEEHPKKQGKPAFSSRCPSYKEDYFVENEYKEHFESSHFGFSRQVPSPETISLEPNSHGSIKVSADDLELNSPASVVSSLCQDTEPKARVQDSVWQEQEMEEEEDEVMSSYVIEITSSHREGPSEVDAIDEAIAWAKEKFLTQSPENEWNMRWRENKHFSETKERPHAPEFFSGHGSMRSLGKKEPENWMTEEGKQQSEKVLQKELELLDEDIRLWSTGKEMDIRLLLSTLHHILWPSSGWYPVPFTNLVENSHVKKAYQRARLCLHPDKLQQRGATQPQKYIAEKAFSILQDAWAALITQDSFSS